MGNILNGFKHNLDDENNRLKEDVKVLEQNKLGSSMFKHLHIFIQTEGYKTKTD